MKIKHYDLFAGIGGFSLALERVFDDATIEHVFCEWETFPTAVLKRLECIIFIKWVKSLTTIENSTGNIGETTITEIRKNGSLTTKPIQSSNGSCIDKQLSKPTAVNANVAENQSQNSSTLTMLIMTATSNENGMVYQEPIGTQSKTTFPILTNFCAGIATCLRAYMVHAHTGTHRA